MTRVYIGTSGWNYAGWSDGVFYPPKLAASRWLEFYAEHFDSVEVNNTFYNLPESRVFIEWREKTPDNFVFAVKASRFITHMKKLAEPSCHVARFLQKVREFQGKLGVVLFQLPPFWKFNSERLQVLAKYLSRQKEISGLRVALELRNVTWNCDACLDVLHQHGIALAFTDWSNLHVESPMTAGFVFVRRHGPKQRYASSYSETALRQDVSRVRDWLAQGKDVFVYFNNDACGYAVRNAQRLKALLETIDH